MKPLIFQSDFGMQDGAVSAMYGVAYTVDSDLHMFDLTHEIEPYNIWDASYRLIQAVGYWPEGSVFVSVVDPGVGSTRRSVVAKTFGGQYVVTPDNGTLTHLKQIIGISEARIIDEKVNRLAGSEESFTFHGRDVYAFTGARLASGIITFEQVGQTVEPSSIVELPTVSPVLGDGFITGTVDVLDVRFGSLWTNIPKEMFKKLGFKVGDKVEVSIENNGRVHYRNIMTFAHSFAEVQVSEALVYINSLNCMAVAINQGSFAKAYNIGTGITWKITISPVHWT